MSEQNKTSEPCEPVVGKQYDWSSFTRTKFINASMQDIYDAWTKSELITTWFLKSADFEANGQARPANEHIQVGDSYRWTWHGYDGEERNKVIEANGLDRLAFGFAQECVVRISILPKDRGHELQLVQEQIPLDEDARVNWHLGCSVGWTMYLMNLKSILEGGLDLRTKDDTQA